MAEHQLVGLAVADVRHVELPGLVADERIEDDMLHDIAQLLHHLVVVAAHQSVGELKDLLDGVGSEALHGLLFVPGTFLAQTVLHIEQSPESSQFFFACMHFVYLFDAKLLIFGGFFVLLQH